MTAPLKMYVLKHRWLDSWIADHDVWPTYITRNRDLATRYTLDEAEAKRKDMDSFAPRFDIEEDTP